MKNFLEMNSSFKKSVPIPLFLHIPKCGGSTITNVLYAQCRLTTRDSRKTKYWTRGVYFYPAGLFSRPTSPSNPTVGKMLKRHDLRAVVGHFSFGIHRYVFQPATYVTVMRNPASRILSLYDELTAQNRIDSTLEEFILTPPFPAIENDQTRRIAGFDPADQEDGEQMLEEAKNNLRTHFGVVGVTERMDEAICLMHRIFGWAKQQFYYPRNVTLKRTENESVSSKLMRLITERNSLDVQLYRFAEQILDEAIHRRGDDFQTELREYKESIKNLVKQVDLNSMDTLERKQVHQYVLDMINKGQSR